IWHEDELLKEIKKNDPNDAWKGLGILNKYEGKKISGIDGWSNPKGYSIYNFMITTADNKEYLYSLCDLSDVSHTAKILRDEIERVLSRIGPNKFAAVVRDNASAILSARKQISEKYPFTLNTNCFFHDVGLVTSVLLPLQKAILNLEGTNVNLADCFIQLVKLAVNINKISPEHGLIEFRNHCIKVINNRWESFEIHPYLLAYFLHPLYHVAELIGQMANFKCSEGVFSIQYSSSYTRPRTWWQVIDDSNEYDYDDLNDNIEVEDENMEESSEEVFDFDAIPEISPPSNM
ncbi:10156_t:CDS:2, partial [Entrophospora sp. SA101]